MAARSDNVIGDFREAGLFGRLSGLALMATVLMGVAACTDISTGFQGRASGEPAAADSPPADVELAAALQRALPPPRGPATLNATPPMPREKPALLLTVSEGETVHGIASRHGVAARKIIALNGLSHPYWLLVGQRLRLPLEAISVDRYSEPSLEVAPRHPQYDRVITVAELATPAEDERPAAPALSTPADEEHATVAALAAPAPAELAAPMPPESPGPRVARAEPASSAPSSLSALAQQADATHVPLPPTRDTFLWPIEGRVISRFGSKPGGMHNDGINIAVPEGSEVRAAKNGVVAYAGNELRGYGNLVLIRHKGGWMTAYAHNDSLLVGKGDVVRRGQVISRSGKTGRVSRPQAHFEIRHDGTPQDPLRLLTHK